MVPIASRTAVADHDPRRVDGEARPVPSSLRSARMTADCGGDAGDDEDDARRATSRAGSGTRSPAATTKFIPLTLTAKPITTVPMISASAKRRQRDPGGGQQPAHRVSRRRWRVVSVVGLAHAHRSENLDVTPFWHPASCGTAQPARVRATRASARPRCRRRRAADAGLRQSASHRIRGAHDQVARPATARWSPCAATTAAPTRSWAT